jgi:N-carbamoylputrescine amidase
MDKESAMKICICEFPDEEARKPEAWKALVEHTANTKPDLVVLPEMPFCEWIFVGEVVDLNPWRDALARHTSVIERFSELSCRWVTSSRPIEHDNQRYNEAFLWSSMEGYQPIRRKWYLPNAPTARETVWFHQGDRDFASITCGSIRLGCQLCSEICKELAGWHSTVGIDTAQT